MNSDVSAKRSLILFFAVALVLFGSVLVTYLIVNPYGIVKVDMPFEPKWKPELVTKTRYGKALDVSANKPDSVILGNSRTEYGIDPEHAFFEGSRVYNLGFSSQSIYESFVYLKHVHSISPLKEALIGIDFDAFNKGTQPGFSEENLCNKDACSNTNMLLEHVFSFGTLESIARTAFNGGIPRFHHLENGMRDPEHNHIFIRKEGGYGKAFESFEKHIIKNYSGGIATINPVAKKVLTEMLMFLHNNNIKATFYFSPAHVRKWALLDFTKKDGFSTWLKWKAEVVKVNEWIAEELRQEAFPIWDFAVFNQYTTETVPSVGSEQEMAYHWDTSHYKKQLGDLILSEMLSGEQLLGVKLTSENVSAHLNQVEADMLAWSESNNLFNKEVVFDYSVTDGVKLESVVDIIEIKSNHLERMESGYYKVTGNDPYLIFYFSKRVDGDKRHLIQADFSCAVEVTEASKFELFWWGKGDKWFSQEKALKGTVSNTKISINIGDDSNWKKAEQVRGFRLDLFNFQNCNEFKIEDLMLYRY